VSRVQLQTVPNFSDIHQSADELLMIYTKFESAVFRRFWKCKWESKTKATYVLWPAVGHLEFDRKLIFKTFLSTGPHGTPASNISR